MSLGIWAETDTSKGNMICTMLWSKVVCLALSSNLEQLYLLIDRN